METDHIRYFNTPASPESPLSPRPSAAPYSRHTVELHADGDASRSDSAAAFVVHPDSVAVGGIVLARQPTGMVCE